MDPPEYPTHHTFPTDNRAESVQQHKTPKVAQPQHMRIFDTGNQSPKVKNSTPLARSSSQVKYSPRLFTEVPPVASVQTPQDFNRNPYTEEDYNPKRFRPEEYEAGSPQYLRPSDLDRSRIWMPPEYPNEVPQGSTSPKFPTPLTEGANSYTGVTLQPGQLPNLTTFGIAGGLFHASRTTPTGNVSTTQPEVVPVFHHHPHSPHQFRARQGHPTMNTLAHEGLQLENFENSPQTSSVEAKNASRVPLTAAFGTPPPSFADAQKQAGIRNWRDQVWIGKDTAHSVFDTRWTLAPEEAWKAPARRNSTLTVSPERKSSFPSVYGTEESPNTDEDTGVDFNEAMQLFMKEHDQEKRERLGLVGEKIAQPSSSEKGKEPQDKKGILKDQNAPIPNEDIVECPELERLNHFVNDISVAQGGLPYGLSYDRGKIRNVFYQVIFQTTRPSVLSLAEKATLVKHKGKNVTYGWLREFLLNEIEDLVSWMTSPVCQQGLHNVRLDNHSGLAGELRATNFFDQRGGQGNLTRASNYQITRPQPRGGEFSNLNDPFEEKTTAERQAQLLAQSRFGGSFNPNHPITKSFAQSYFGAPSTSKLTGPANTQTLPAFRCGDTATSNTQTLPRTRFGDPATANFTQTQKLSRTRFGDPSTANFIMNQQGQRATGYSPVLGTNHSKAQIGAPHTPQSLPLRQKPAEAPQPTSNSQLPPTSRQGILSNLGTDTQPHGSNFGAGIGSSSTSATGGQMSPPYLGSNLMHLLQPGSGYQATQQGQPQPSKTHGQLNLAQILSSHGSTATSISQSMQHQAQGQPFAGQMQLVTNQEQAYASPFAPVHHSRAYVSPYPPVQQQQAYISPYHQVQQQQQEYASPYPPVPGSYGFNEHGQPLKYADASRQSYIPEGRWARPPAPGRIAPLYAQPDSVQLHQPTIPPHCALIALPEWQSRCGTPQAPLGPTSHPTILTYRIGSDNMYPRVAPGVTSMRYQNLTRNDPPKAAVACNPQNLPFVETAYLSKPAGWGVLKTKNIPYDVTPAQILNFLGTHAKTITPDLGPAIHIMMERSTGKTMDCYIEFFSVPDAMAWLSVILSRPQHFNKIGDRLLEVELSSQEDLMKELFPKARCVTWRPANGKGPEVLETSEAFDSGFKGFVSQEELGGLVRHAEQPHRSIFTQKCPSRPYTTMISILAKFPWHATTLYTIATRNALYGACLALIKTLTSFLRRTDSSNSQVSNQSQQSGLTGVTLYPGEIANPFFRPNLSSNEMTHYGLQNAGLNEALLKELALAGLNAFGFAESQRWELMTAAQSVLGRQWIRLSPLSNGWPLELLGRKSGMEEEVVEFYAHMLRNHPKIYMTTRENNAAHPAYAVTVAQPFGNWSAIYPHIWEDATAAEMGQQELMMVIKLIKEQCAINE